MGVGLRQVCSPEIKVISQQKRLRGCLSTTSFVGNVKMKTLVRQFSFSTHWSGDNENATKG